MVNVILHIVPDNDLIDHEPATTCICGPTKDIVITEEGETQWIITHHALDGRGTR